VVGVLAVGTFLTVAGLVALHHVQRAAYGTLGRVGFVLALVGVLAATAVFVAASVLLSLVAILLGVIGLTLVAVAVARRPVLPHWSGFLALLGFVGLVAVGDPDFGSALNGVVWIVLGSLLRSARVAPAAAPV
jgi:hypothetical protein